MGVKTVEVPKDIFARSPVIPVPLDAAEILNYFATNPAADHLPPYVAGQVGTEQVALRWCTFVPHFLAPYFLSERRAPKELYLLLLPAITQRGLLVECKPLVDWLKALVIQEGGGLQNGSCARPCPPKCGRGPDGPSHVAPPGRPAGTMGPTSPCSGGGSRCLDCTRAGRNEARPRRGFGRQEEDTNQALGR